jgi:hypothetical protein
MKGKKLQLIVPVALCPLIIWKAELWFTPISHFLYNQSTSKVTLKTINATITIKQVISKRRDIATPCFAHSLSQVFTCWEETSSRTAFLCDQEIDLKNKEGQPQNLIIDHPICLPERAVLVVRDAVVVDRRGVVLDIYDQTIYDVSGGCCITQGAPFWSKLWQPGDTYLSSDHEQRQQRPMVLLAHSHDITYYHFLIETLGRLVLVDLLVELISSRAVDFFFGGHQPFHRKLLDIILCDEVNTTNQPISPSCYEQNRVKTVDNVVFSSLLLPPAAEQADLSVTSKVIHGVIARHKLICPNSTHHTAAPRRWVVLKREAKRRVLNLDDLVERLRDAHPFTDMVTVSESEISTMTLFETARLFCQAHGILGGHGAGLANMVLLHPELLPKSNHTAKSFPVVVQIIRPGQTGNVYGKMARQLGLGYFEIRSIPLTANATGVNKEDAMVDINDAVEKLRPLFRDGE